MEVTFPFSAVPLYQVCMSPPPGRETEILLKNRYGRSGVVIESVLREEGEGRGRQRKNRVAAEPRSSSSPVDDAAR